MYNFKIVWVACGVLGGRGKLYVTRVSEKAIFPIESTVHVHMCECTWIGKNLVQLLYMAVAEKKGRNEICKNP